jgi:Retrotransposon gag protein
MKLAEPTKFDGKDLSVATVSAWAFTMKEYLELSGARIPVENHVRTAAMYLEGNAKLWYMNTYASMTPKPTLDIFLREFKLQHTRTNNDSDIANQLETIRQGNRSVADHAMEFKFLHLQRDIPDVQNA